MGILNLTPDSFFDGNRFNAPDMALQRVSTMIAEGADIIDIGGASSRPGAAVITEAEELDRVIPVIQRIATAYPNQLLSIDTWRAAVAAEAVKHGAHIINDISGGTFDEQMLTTVAALGVPYILMHIKGEPETMHLDPHYDNVVEEVLDYFIDRVGRARAAGIKDIILDPGFGFSKTTTHNYALMARLDVFTAVTGLPVLAGVSRKRMICEVLACKPADALNGTTVLNTLALHKGAALLRVHDVKQAVEAVMIHQRVGL